MKQRTVKRWMLAGTLLLTVPAAVFAQKEKDDKIKSKDGQVIVITRKGNTDDKTIVEVQGDKVKINGKDAADVKDADVSVKVRKFRDMDNLSPMAMTRIPGAGTWNFNMNDDGVSLFGEDANRAMLGVVTDSDDKGAKITQVSKESAAEKAGLQKGDIITHIDNKSVKDASDVADIVHDHKPGDKVTITVLRDGKEQKVTAELGKWKGVRVQAFRNAPGEFNLIAPEIWDAAPPTPPVAPRTMPFRFRDNENVYISGGQPKLGLSVQDNEDGKGVKVMDVDEDSNAGKAGIKEDDVITSVNGEEVNGTDDITRIVRTNRDKSTLSFKVLRNGKTQTVDVRVPKKIKTADL